VAILSVIVAVISVTGAITRPGGLPAWAVPVAGVVVDLASGAATLHGTGEALRRLGAPIGFLLAAVPLAVLLDRLGFFAAASRRLTRGRRAVGGLWILAAGVTTVLNLDASVVLLTPLYVRFARSNHLDALTLAFQPLILSGLASSALPVSNLTNLIAASATGASSLAFLGHLGLPSLVATGVGWLCYRRLPAHADGAAASRSDGPEDDDAAVTDDRRPLLVGGAVVLLVLIGFVAARSLGLDEWEVALAADLVLVAVVRGVPWRSLPIDTALVAGALAVVAAAVATHLAVGDLFGRSDLAGLAQTAGVSALLANLVNNLPALIVTLPTIGPHPTASLWAVLIGVNMGPVLLATGTLASLLWLATLRRLDVEVSAFDVTRVGIRVGLPAARSGLATLLVLHAAGVAR
jgi:arsenical pump membrane protein